MTPRNVQAALNAHGFPCGAIDGDIGPKSRAATARFQAAWCGWDGFGWLDIDGIPGPLTERCLEQLPRLAPHFVVAELRSKGDGTCYVRRELLAALEELRRSINRPIAVRSGYRDPAHNRAVGGAPASMHVEGLAADLVHPCSVTEAQRLGIFIGIGDKAGRVAHVDLRHLSPGNKTPGATPSRPARWHY